MMKAYLSFLQRRLLEATDLSLQLHEDAFEGNIEALRTKLSQGANPNQIDEHDKTPLRYAIIKGHIEAVKLLLAKGADVNCIDKEKRTLLHWAAFYKNSNVLEALFTQRFIEIDAKDNYGETALCIAAHSCCDALREGGAALYNAECYRQHIKVLLEKGADVKEAKAAEVLRDLFIELDGDDALRAMLIVAGLDIQPDVIEDDEERARVQEIFKNIQKFKSVLGPNIKPQAIPNLFNLKYILEYIECHQQKKPKQDLEDHIAEYLPLPKCNTEQNLEVVDASKDMAQKESKPPFVQQENISSEELLEQRNIFKLVHSTKKIPLELLNQVAVLLDKRVEGLAEKLHIGFKEAQTLWLGLEDKTSEVSKLYEGFSEEFIKAMLPVSEESNNPEVAPLAPSP